MPQHTLMQHFAGNTPAVRHHAILVPQAHTHSMAQFVFPVKPVRVGRRTKHILMQFQEGMLVFRRQDFQGERLIGHGQLLRLLKQRSTCSHETCHLRGRDTMPCSK